MKSFFAALALMAALALTACAPRQPYSEGELAYAQGNYPQALRVFRSYSERQGPKRIEAMYYYGMCQVKLGDTAKGDETLARAARFCDDRALRARIIAARAEIARSRGNVEGSEEVYAELRENYYDVFTPEAVNASRAEAAFNDPLRGEMAMYPDVSATPNLLHRVRLTATYATKAEAMTEVYRLNELGVEAVAVRLPRNVYAVQIGAFRNPRLAEAMADQANRLGYQVAIMKSKI